MVAAAVSSSKEAVLASAITAFARKGYAGTSVTDILSATGLSKPTLYYYFGSKAGLFRSILDFAYDESFRQVTERAAEAPADCTARLNAVAAALFKFASAHSDLIRLVMASAFAPPDELPPDTFDPARRQRVVSFIEELVRAGQKAGELGREYKAAELAEAFLGTVMHPIRINLLTKSGRLDAQRAARVVNLFLKGAQS